MTTTRKRSSGFNVPPSEEEVKVEDVVKDAPGVKDETVREESETLENLHEFKVTVPPKMFVEESITPSEDLSPRFVAEEVKPVTRAPQPAEEPKTKRHPRNIPRFSRTR